MFWGIYSPYVGVGLILLVLLLWWANGTLDPFTPRAQSPRKVAPSVSPERQREIITAICPEIRRVLETELRAGNRIIGVFDKDRPLEVVQLGLIFQSEPQALPPQLSFRPFDPKVFSDGDAILCSEHPFIVLGATPTVEEWRSDSVCVAHKREARFKELAQH